MSSLTYDEMVEKVVAERNARFNIGGIEIGGKYDQITHTLVWQANYAIRDEAWVRDVVEGRIR